MRTIPDIIKACGGHDAVAGATGLKVDAVRKWPRNGIPEKHWADLRHLCDASVEELHAVNEAARSPVTSGEAV